jgi:hypothetical protein
MIVVFFLYVVRPGVSALAPFRFRRGLTRDRKKTQVCI